MKTLAVTALMFATTAQAHEPAQQAPVQQGPTQQAPAQQAPVLPMADTQSFICNDGQFVSLNRDQSAGILRVIRAGETIVLQEQVGYNPPRFVLDSSRVELDGDTATITRGVTRNAQQIASCKRTPDAPAPGTVWGTLTKLDRMALPPGTRAKVLLVDGARMDAPSVELGSTQITTVGNQVPLHFLISYDPARTAQPARALLQARIETADGKLLYITETANQIPGTDPAPSPIELKLVKAP